MKHFRAVVLAVSACLLLALAPAAYATSTRYASPTSSDGTGACDHAASCTLRWAILGAAAGDTVIVAPGDYTITSPIKPTVAVRIKGDDALPMPSIVGAPTLAKDALDLGPGSLIRHMRIESTAPDRDALDLNGAIGEDLILVISSAATGTAGHPPAAGHLTGSSVAPTILRDSVAFARGDGSAGVVVTNSKTPLITDAAHVTNVTAVAAGAASSGLLSTLAIGSVLVRNSIMRGVLADAAATTLGTTFAAYSSFRPASGSNVVDLGANQSGDPLFVDASAGDFHVRAGSPVIDAGTDDALKHDGDQFDPDGRVRDYGAGPDIGAFEYVGPFEAPIVPPGTPVPPSSPTSPTSPASPATPAAPLAGQVAPSLQPQVGTMVVGATVSGVVTFRAPNSAERKLAVKGAAIPVGSIIDASRGVMQLQSVGDRKGTVQTARFWGGAFVIRQNRKGDLTTTLGLRGGSRAGCPARAAAAHAAIAHAARRPRRVRGLWGSDNGGRFRTRGANSVATVRGTRWWTEDRCDGTLTRVSQGSVLVRNLRTGRRVIVRAGHSYLARGRR